MFRAIFGNILQSFGTVFWKKTLLVSRLPKLLFRFFWEINGLVIAIIVMWLSWFERSIFLNMRIVGGVVLTLILDLWYDYIQQWLYREEKISTMMPYENLNCVFVIVIWYLIFRDASLIAVGVSILVIIITILFSIDFKKFELPKNIKKILFVQVLITLETLLTWYFLKDLADKDYFVVYQIVIVIMLLFPLLFNKLFGAVKKMGKSFLWYGSLSATANNISFLLYLFLVSEFGVVISMLLSFLGDGITILFWFLFLKEKPSKKEVLLIVLTTLLVGVGFYFK